MNVIVELRCIYWKYASDAASYKGPKGGVFLT